MRIPERNSLLDECFCRSRNDQVAAAFRLYVLDACAEAREAIDALALVVLSFAESEAETVMPGYTHMQRAQPVTLGHHLLACRRHRRWRP